MRRGRDRGRGGLGLGALWAVADAQMLLDLDLLRETDPRLQREEPVARSVRLLELLERLNPAAVRRGGDARPAPKQAC